MISNLGVEISEKIIIINPLIYLEFLKLQADAKFIITDSGGIQEESCTLKVPCVTIRDNTERPETLSIGSNILAGVNPNSILEKSKLMFNKERIWDNPYGDGNSAKEILDALEKESFK